MSVDAPSSVAPQPRPKRRRWGLRLMITGVVILVIGIVTAVIGATQLAGKFDRVRVPSDAMANTIQTGQQVLIESGIQNIERGDIVEFQDDYWPGSRHDDVIKRVLAIGGDTIASRDGTHITVNGHPVNETYVDTDQPALSIPFSVAVPKGRVFLAGDNRSNSVDSRTFANRAPDHGTVPVSAIAGVVVATGNGSPLHFTTAFTDAGLAGAPNTATAIWAAIAITATGIGVMAFSLLILLLAGMVAIFGRNRRRADILGY